MASDTVVLFWGGVAAVALGAAYMYGYGKERAAKARDDEHNKKLKAELDSKQIELLNVVKNNEKAIENAKNALKIMHSEARSEIDKRNRELDDLQKHRESIHSAFKNSIASGLDTLASYISMSDKAFDDMISAELRFKKRPAIKAADAIDAAKAETRQIKKQLIVANNVIALYETQAPWISSALDCTPQDIVTGLEIIGSIEEGDGDHAERFLTKTEWASLPVAARNQLALDRYFDCRQKSAWLAGVMYERYVGYLYEEAGWKVTYHGATEKKEDQGIDLICESNGEYVIVQCKRLSKDAGRVVRENTVAQIYGASIYYAIKHKIPKTKVEAAIFTTTTLSSEAADFAKMLGVVVMDGHKFERYNCIKCNVSKTGEKIYHLPFDQQYDKTLISPDDGDLYVETVAEAEKLGFRRAQKWRGISSFDTMRSSMKLF